MQGPAGNSSHSLTGGPPSTVASGAGRCESGALMHSFGIFLQGLLGVVAFSTLMLKRFREPKHERRPWRIWFLDTSKQAIGMLFIHFANVYLADLNEEDPCSLYLINFLLDATVGMLLIYVGVRAVSVLVEWQQWESLRFGEYGDPLQCGAWVGQCALYIVIMIFEKSVVFIVLLILQWKKVALLNPIENPDLKLAIVMLIVPFFVNVSALLHFITSVCSMPSRVPFKILTEKTPSSTWVPPCKYLPTLIPTPDLETSELLPQHADPAPGPLCKVEGPGIFVVPSLPGNCHICNSDF
ncbi:store-operated calcium entry regulator STIMATE isoform X1 [Bos javanicus]|uniref:store-operated calcium entry regulator STIMATE isoform X1 n=1 Tax=Bos taurus TaxID=9913 RepID=UPI0028CB4445|nr:store-operated calcium entry regulator STIMATE isoform X1 [Bos taurus]XP_061252687.1 store-operated calcium entry regulator STIMATE isoform X1 [Bos javanicus]